MHLGQIPRQIEKISPQQSLEEKKTLLRLNNFHLE